MSLSEKTLSNLQHLIAQDKKLLADIRSAKDAAQVATFIAEAAAEGGVSVSESEVLTHLEDALNASANQALTDRQLDAVAGGWTPPPVKTVNGLEELAPISVNALGVHCSFARPDPAVDKMIYL